MSNAPVTETPTAREADAGGSSSKPSVSASAAAARRRLRVPSLTRYSGLFIWAGFILIFALWVPDTFLTTLTWQNIVSEQAVTTIVALGLLFPLAAGAYDLSVGTMLGLSAVVTAKLTAEHGVGTEEALAIALAIGALVGVVNGALIVGIGINSFIATLATSSILTAGIHAFTNDNFIGGVPESYQSLVNHQPLGIPQIALYVVALAFVCWYFLEHTATGRRLAGTGFGSEASKLAGVKTGKLTFGALIVSAVFAALAGALLSAKLATATPDLGPPYVLPVFAAVFLGSTQIKPGRFNVWGTILAILLLATGVKGLQLAGAASWVTDLFNGVALIIAVSLSLVEQRVAVMRRMRERVRRTNNA
jgi:ribose transport system permease protein